jgi:hypothetical protein
MEEGEECAGMQECIVSMLDWVRKVRVGWWGMVDGES